MDTRTKYFTEETARKIAEMIQEWRLYTKRNIYTHNRKKFYFIKLYCATLKETNRARKIAKSYGFKNIETRPCHTGGLIIGRMDCIVRIPFEK